MQHPKANALGNAFALPSPRANLTNPDKSDPHLLRQIRGVAAELCKWTLFLSDHGKAGTVLADETAAFAAQAGDVGRCAAMSFAVAIWAGNDTHVGLVGSQAISRPAVRAVQRASVGAH